MRVTDGRPGKAEAPRAHRRAFQVTVKEVRAAPDVVAGTYLFIHVILIFIYAYTMFHIGNFLVNYVPASVLFDLSTSQSFVSVCFSLHISVRRKALSRPLRVSIADEHVVFSTDVFRGCVL